MKDLGKMLIKRKWHHQTSLDSTCNETFALSSKYSQNY